MGSKLGAAMIGRAPGTCIASQSGPRARIATAAKFRVTFSARSLKPGTRLYPMASIDRTQRQTGDATSALSWTLLGSLVTLDKTRISVTGESIEIRQ